MVWATVVSFSLGVVLVIVAGANRDVLDDGADWLFEVVVALGSSLMGVGVLALIFEVSTHRSVMTEVLATVGLNEEVNASGVLAMPSSREKGRVGLAENLTESREVDLIYVSSRWLDNNSSKLKARLKRGGARVRILLPNPDDDKLLIQLLTRFDHESLVLLQADVRIAAHHAVELKTAYPPKYLGERLRSGVEVKWLNVVPTYALFRVGDRGVLEFYEMRKERAERPPTLVYQQAGSLAEFAALDFEALWASSETSDAKTRTSTVPASSGLT